MQILAFVFIGLCVICALRESSVVAPYKLAGLFGRFKAYLALDLTFGGIFMAGNMVYNGIQDPGHLGLALLGVVGCLLISVLGALIYRSVLRKCGDLPKAKVLIDMIVVALGVTMKIAVFFLGFVWKMSAPKTYVDENGFTVIDMGGGDLYNPDISRRGKMQQNSDGTMSVVYYN